MQNYYELWLLRGHIKSVKIRKYSFGIFPGQPTAVSIAYQDSYSHVQRRCNTMPPNRMQHSVVSFARIPQGRSREQEEEYLLLSFYSETLTSTELKILVNCPDARNNP